MPCSNCGATVGPDEVFCGQCGARVAPPALPPVVSPPPDQRRASFPWVPLAVGGCALVVVVGCLVLLVLGGMGALLAPQVVPVAQATPTHTPRPPSPTPVPTNTRPPSPTATSPAGILAYQDDFSRVTGDWSVSDGDSYSRLYRDGEYHFTMKSANAVYWSILRKKFTDCNVQVEARLVDGPESGAYALVFRYQDQDNYYIFYVFPSGQYWLSKREQGQWTSLIEKTESVYVHQGRETNHLRVECAGYWVRLYVNDQYLNAALDNTFRSGQLGVAVGTWDEGNVHAAFDNFQVWEQ